MQEKKHNAHKFVEKQKHVTEKVKLKRYQEERARYSTWRKDLAEVEKRIQEK